MEVSEIKRRFDAAIDDAVSSAGATLGEGARDELDPLTEKAAGRVSGSLEDRQEKLTADGEAAYRRLVDEMAAFVKRHKMPMDLNRGVVQAALWNLRFNRDGSMYW